MAKIKLTKTVVDAAKAGAQDIELRDTLVPGFLCKVTPTGRKVFMVQYRTNAGERRKPSIGQFGELTVEQARSLAQDWLAEVRHGKDPSSLKAAARQAPRPRLSSQRPSRPATAPVVTWASEALAVTNSSATAICSG